MNDLTPIPAESPLGGTLWTVVIPAALLVFSAWATWALYRHFSNR